VSVSWNAGFTNCWASGRVYARLCHVFLVSVISECLYLFLTKFITCMYNNVTGDSEKCVIVAAN